MPKKNDITKILRVRFGTEIKATKEEGIIEAYVSIFNNIDSDGDIIVRGAFLESLAKKFPKGVWSHNWDQPIAKTLEAREDEKGLYIKGQFVMSVQKAKEAYDLIKAEVIDEFSIGFRILDWEYNDAGNRVIKKVKLYEWSPVLAGANPETEVLGIKSAKFNVKGEDAEEAPEGTPHIVNERDLEENPELADAGVKVGDTIYIPESDDLDADTPPADTPLEGVAPEAGEPAAVDPVPAPEAIVEDPKPDTETEDLGKSLKEFSQTVNNLLVAFSPLAEKIEKSLSLVEGTKVNAEPASALKVLRLKQATKRIDKNAEAILRILKSKD